MFDNAPSNMDESAWLEWRNGRWEGRVRWRAVDQFCRLLDHPATVRDVDKFVRDGGRVPDIREFIDDEARENWDNDRWAKDGSLLVPYGTLLKFAYREYERTGRKVSSELINGFIAEYGMRRTKVVDRITDSLRSE